ncbi:hypothetical protein SLEP1_g15186 [Rubroshorea leprosula]|uniref:Uncharacterized protein n=1 Tax=Rubroshorea leprosula TaxID=152421 RepID=A0AAV5ILK0_9ROSI|nr:hypothetical protein SLEP1_g15186 [Rubroshorea leprosula]
MKNRTRKSNSKNVCSVGKRPSPDVKEGTLNGITCCTLISEAYLTTTVIIFFSGSICDVKGW